jgi:mannitol/fructose-specific phosphotransferase system IIA component (Ntr-type)
VSEAPEVADGERLIEAIMEREAIMSTGIGLGIAIPHAKIESVTDFVIGLGKSNAGIEFNSLDEKPVHFLVMIAGPKDQQERYLQLLAKITLKLKDSTVRRRLSEASSVDEIRSALS